MAIRLTHQARTPGSVVQDPDDGDVGVTRRSLLPDGRTLVSYDGDSLSQRPSGIEDPGGGGGTAAIHLNYIVIRNVDDNGVGDNHNEFTFHATKNGAVVGHVTIQPIVSGAPPLAPNTLVTTSFPATNQPVVIQVWEEDDPFGDDEWGIIGSSNPTMTVSGTNNCYWKMSELFYGGPSPLHRMTLLFNWPPIPPVPFCVPPATNSNSWLSSP